ncbi:hypothetical protein B0J13DRAFT_18926 [Dactylonectria estremocensis]|uniref:Uncharacterized protein n=1 Tax=Dactylonectria estremocensis TaxID=1079267 RepID=A0A9P9FKT8_9HYPO|nr:hypothetical protein B0J13DRAFT_18926 [Dactylonectria estremocensis]
MGFLDSFNDGGSIISGRSSRHKKSSSSKHKKRRSGSRSRSRSSSRNRRSSGRSISGSIFGGGGDRHDKYDKHNSSRGSFFGLGGNNSRSSFFGSNRSSYYKRSPRQGFIQKSVKQVKRLFRDLVHWAKRHPWKVFFMVIMPLITGGFLTALLARFGLRIPPAIERMMSTASKAASGNSAGLVGDAVRMASGGFGGGSSSSSRDAGFGFGGGSDNSWGGGGLAGMAKKFM